MDFLLKETNGVVSDLFELCEGILKQMSSQPDTLKKIKKQIKSYLQINGSGNNNSNKSKQERRLTLDMSSQSPQPQSTQPTRTQVRLLSQSVSEIRKRGESNSDLDTVSKDSGQETQINERVTNLILTKLSEFEVSENIIQKIIKNFKSDPIEYLGSTNPIIIAIDDNLAYISNIKQELEGFNSQTLQKLMDDLINYYSEEREKIVKQFEEMFNNEVLEKLDPQQIEFIVQKRFSEEIVSVSGPFIEESLVTQRNLSKFLQQGSYEVQRIAVELIQPYQKNLMIYLMNKFLLNNHIQPSIVIRVKELQKEKKTFTYFLITPKLDQESLVNLEEYSFDQDSNNFVKEGDIQSTIKLDQFIQHVLCALLTVPLESFLPNYAVDHEGNLFRVFNQISSKEGRTNHSGNNLFLLFCSGSNRILHLFNFLFLISDKKLIKSLINIFRM